MPIRLLSAVAAAMFLLTSCAREAPERRDRRMNPDTPPAPDGNQPPDTNPDNGNGSGPDDPSPVIPPGTPGAEAALVVIADSIGAGTLAKTNLDAPDESISYLMTNHGDQLPALLDLINGNGGDTAPLFEAVKVPEYAAYSSFDPWALPARLEEQRGSAFRLVLVDAEAGMNTFNVPDRIDSLKKKAGSGPAVVFFSVGHNDFCNTPADNAGLEKLRKDYTDAVNAVKTAFPGSEMYFMLPLNIGSLSSIEQTLQANVGIPLELECSQIRESYCPIMENDPGDVIARKGAYDNIIREVVQKAATDHSGRITLLSAAATMPITKSDLAVDCFHPNLRGQKKLAETLATEMQP